MSKCWLNLEPCIKKIHYSSFLQVDKEICAICPVWAYSNIEKEDLGSLFGVDDEYPNDEFDVLELEKEDTELLKVLVEEKLIQVQKALDEAEKDNRVSTEALLELETFFCDLSSLYQNFE